MTPARPRPAVPRPRAAVGLLALLAALTWAGAAPAIAHDQLLSSDPADGAVLEAAPAAITLTFSAEILPVGPTVLVQDAAGAAVVDAEPAVAGAVVTQPMPPGVPSGAYTVLWRVVSADGHPIEGTFGFTVAADAEPLPSAPPPTSPSATATATASTTHATSAASAPESTATAPAETSGLAGIPPAVRLLVALAAVGAVATAAIVVARRRAS